MLIVKLLKIVVLFVLCNGASSAAMFENSKYIPADDEDLENYPDMDSELKDIVRRVVRVWDGEEAFGSGLLVGDKCEALVTAKHNIYDKGGSGNRYSDDKIYYEFRGEEYKISDPEKKIAKWKTQDEGLILHVASTSPNMRCERIPLIERDHIRNFPNCQIIGFPSKHSSKVDSIIKDGDGSFFKNSKRGIAKCSIKGKTPKGMVIHNCSATEGASGGPIVCRVNGRWSYVAVHNGDVCKVDGKKGADSYCYSPNETVTFSKDINNPNRVYGRAGSFPVSMPYFE